MNARFLGALAMFVTWVLWPPSAAEACACGGTISSPVAFRHSAAVFLGRIVGVTRPLPRSWQNADGSVSIEAPPNGPTVISFEVTRTFRGSDGDKVALQGDATDCDFPFKVNEVWLIYAVEQTGVLTTNKCSRTRLASEATEDLKYLNGLLEGRPQAVLYVNVFRRMITDDVASNGALFETLDVVAVGAGQRFVANTDRWGPYQIVLPPGEFEVWVERAGQRVTSTSWVRDSDGDERARV
jgi:hypothetical protein